MENWLIDNQLTCRIAFFVFFFGLFFAWESRTPWRGWLMPRRLRLARHLSLSVISKLCIRVVFPFFGVGVAILFQDKQLGLLTRLHLPSPVHFVLSIIAMDFVVYYQHRMLHRYQILWRCHRVHHFDKQLDVTTGIRFHPLEELFSMGMKSIGIVLFGVGPLAYIVFEILLNAASLFTHVNVKLSKWAEKWVRTIFVTPGMHRIHHSDFNAETNSNFGFCLSVWDRVFSSYCPTARRGEHRLYIGLDEYADPKYQSLENMLLNPFDLKSRKVRPKRIRPTKRKIKERLPQSF